MPLPVIPNIWQVRLSWFNALAPRKASNTFHLEVLAPPLTAQQIYTLIDGDVTSDMWGVVAAGSVVDTVELIPLDGVTAGQTFVTGSTAKWTGQGTTDLILQASAVVSLKSAVRGPAGRNRIYLPWVGEGNQLNGTFTGAGFTNMPTAWANFAAAMLADGIPLRVVSPSNTDAYDLASLKFSSSVRTQRRRTRR